MKKILALLLSLVMMLSLAACGGAPADNTSSSSEGGSSSPEASEPAEPEITYTEGFFYMELPFESELTFSNSESDWKNVHNDDQRISIEVSSYEETAQEEIDEYNGAYAVGGPFEAGGYTWQYVNAYNNRYEYYTDLSDGHHLCITTFGFEAEDPAIITMLESLKLSDNPFEDNQAYYKAEREAKEAAEAEESESE